MLTWIAISAGYARGFLDLDELKNVYYGIDISDTPLLRPSVWNEKLRINVDTHYY